MPSQENNVSVDTHTKIWENSGDLRRLPGLWNGIRIRLAANASAHRIEGRGPGEHPARSTSDVPCWKVTFQGSSKATAPSRSSQIAEDHNVRSSVFMIANIGY